jgi:hypothetical protein
MAAASYSPSVGVRLGVVRPGEQGLGALAARSRAALDATLREPGELWVAVASEPGVLLGAFQRTQGLQGQGLLRRRGSGGPEVRVAPGSVHVLLSLASPAALVPCDEKRIVNRHVRPLLRALTRTGHLAHYFGRDWVSVAGQPVAWVGFAHDATTRRTVFEALVAIGAPFAVRPRESLRGKDAGVVDVEPSRLVDAIVEAYGRDAEPVPLGAPAALADEAPADEPPWAATREEVIGTLGAGPDAQGTFRVGGDLLASRDALARFEAAVVVPGVDLGRVTDDTLAAPGVALDGVRSLSSVRDCVTEALLGPQVGHGPQG